MAEHGDMDHYQRFCFHFFKQTLPEAHDLNLSWIIYICARPQVMLFAIMYIFELSLCFAL